MSDNDTRAALDAAMDTWGAAEIHAASGGFERADVEEATAKRAALDRTIAAHVAAEVAASRPTPDEARRLVDALETAAFEWGMRRRDYERDATFAARTALLRALGVEGGS